MTEPAISEKKIADCTTALFSAATKGASPREQVIAVLEAYVGR